MIKTSPIGKAISDLMIATESYGFCMGYDSASDVEHVAIQTEQTDRKDAMYQARQALYDLIDNAIATACDDMVRAAKMLRLWNGL